MSPVPKSNYFRKYFICYLGEWASHNLKLNFCPSCLLYHQLSAASDNSQNYVVCCYLFCLLLLLKHELCNRIYCSERSFGQSLNFQNVNFDVPSLNLQDFLTGSNNICKFRLTTHFFTLSQRQRYFVSNEIGMRLKWLCVHWQSRLFFFFSSLQCRKAIEVISAKNISIKFNIDLLSQPSIKMSRQKNYI